MITTRARLAWYACLALTILGIQMHAAMFAIVVLGLAGVALPSLLLAAYGPAGLRELLPTIRLGRKPHEGRITTMHAADGGRSRSEGTRALS